MFRQDPADQLEARYGDWPIGRVLCNFHVAPDPAESVSANVSPTAQIYPMLSLFATFMHLDYCNNQFQTATISTISHA